MSSGWEAYSILWFAAACSLIFPFIFFVLSKLLAPRSRQTSPSEPRLPVANPKVNSRFFLLMNTALILIAMALILIPCAAFFGHLAKTGKVDGQTSLAILSVVLFLSLALFYASKKGDLNWLRSFRSRK